MESETLIKPNIAVDMTGLPHSLLGAKQVLERMVADCPAPEIRRLAMGWGTHPRLNSNN